MVPWKIFGRLVPVIAASLFMICSVGAWSQQGSQNSDAPAPPANTQGQSERNQPDKTQHSDKAPTAAKDGSPADNAFPEAQSEAAAKADAQRAAQQSQQPIPQTTEPANTSTPKPNAGSSQTKRSVALDNPFPEAQSKAAAKADSAGAQQSGNAQTSGPSSSGAYSSSDAHLPPPDLGQGNLGSHEKLDSFTRDQTQDGRIEDDLNVADLYMKNGNYRGALLRYQDAIQYDPQDDTALYGIANALCKENRTSEAMDHFKSYAKNNPQGKYAIKAEKMLAHPNKCMHNW